MRHKAGSRLHGPDLSFLSLVRDKTERENSKQSFEAEENLRRGGVIRIYNFEFRICIQNWSQA